MFIPHVPTNGLPVPAVRALLTASLYLTLAAAQLSREWLSRIIARRAIKHAFRSFFCLSHCYSAHRRALSSGDDLVPIADLTRSLNLGTVFLFQHLKPFTTESESRFIMFLSRLPTNPRRAAQPAKTTAHLPQVVPPPTIDDVSTSELSEAVSRAQLEEVPLDPNGKVRPGCIVS